MAKKESVMVEHLVAGLILKFGKCDLTDVKILIDGLKDVVDIDGSEVMCAFSIDEWDKYISKVYKSLNNKMLVELQEETVKTYLEALDLSEFVLRKIALLGSSCGVLDSKLINYFSVVQLSEIKKLCNDGYVAEYYHDEGKKVALTQDGAEYLSLIASSEGISKGVPVPTRKRTSSMRFPGGILC